MAPRAEGSLAEPPCARASIPPSAAEGVVDPYYHTDNSPEGLAKWPNYLLPLETISGWVVVDSGCGAKARYVHFLRSKENEKYRIQSFGFDFKIPEEDAAAVDYLTRGNLADMS